MKQIEKLYLEHKQDVYNYLMSITHNPALSEDLLSETFIRAIYSIGKFRGDSSVKTWLFGIARNLWLQHLRKDRPTVEYSDLLGLYVSDSILDSCITGQIADRVRELLKTREEKVQRIVNMRIWGISYQEISAEVGIEENSARVIDFRTKRWLKSMLEKEGLI
jgi:RNA polymerase sigma factor (sigma-70 family)